MEHSMFATLSKESVQMMADAAGHAHLPDDVAGMLAEDICYRLREVVMKSTGYVKNAKRRRMCPDDFNQALRDSDLQPVFGSGADAVPFRQTREGELHFVEDADITLSNIVFSSYVPKHLGRSSLKNHWLAVEGVQKVSNPSHQLLHSKQNKKIDPDLVHYYSEVTKSLVGSDMASVKTALEDLATNPAIPALLPYFINFVANGVKAVSHDNSKLTVLMHTVESLIQNPAIFLEHQPYLNKLVQAVESCMIEPLAVSFNDHWRLRDYAARLLSQIIRRWNNSVNQLYSNTVQTLSKVLQDLHKPFCAHYGSVMGLISLGCREIEEVLLPQLPTFWPHLSAAMESESRNTVVKSDAHRVYGIMLMAAQMVLKNRIRLFADSVVNHPEQDNHPANYRPEAGNSPDGCPASANKSQSSGASSFGLTTSSTQADGGLGEANPATDDMASLYQQLYEYFGDSLAVQLPVLKFDSIPYRPVDETLVTIGEDCTASGEKLLADLMQQVKQETEEQRQKQERSAFRRKRSRTQSAGGGVDVGGLSETKSDVSDDSEDEERSHHYSQQLAISSTISDPSKGTLKLKISKKQAQHGESPPSYPLASHSHSRLTFQINKPQHHRTRSPYDKHKRKQRQQHKSVLGGETALGSDSSDSDGYDIGNQPMADLSGFVYSPEGVSSGSDSHSRHKGPLMLKLKVPSKDSPSE